MFFSKGFPRFIHVAVFAAAAICVGRLVLSARASGENKTNAANGAPDHRAPEPLAGVMSSVTP
jgi:hypothetical protein